MKDFPEGYRKNVAVIVRDPSNGKLLFCRRCDTDNWQFPQGGIDTGEDTTDAMFRELYEEVGLGKEDINIVTTSKEWITYDIPTSIRSYVLGGKFKGQIQNTFLVYGRREAPRDQKSIFLTFAKYFGSCDTQSSQLQFLQLQQLPI